MSGGRWSILRGRVQGYTDVYWRLWALSVGAEPMSAQCGQPPCVRLHAQIGPAGVVAFVHLRTPPPAAVTPRSASASHAST